MKGLEWSVTTDGKVRIHPADKWTCECRNKLSSGVLTVQSTVFVLYQMRRVFVAFTGCWKALEHIFILAFQETGNILNFCEVGLKISGVSPISSQAAIHFPNTSLTSVSMASTERHTVAFLGTSEGNLKKVT